jgi:hypothetical protein
MKTEAVLFGLAVAAPLLCQVLVQGRCFRLLLSMATSPVLMSACLVVGEAHAPQPDFDIVFGASLAVWNGVAVIYAVLVWLLFEAIGKVVTGLRDRHSTLNHE